MDLCLNSWTEEVMQVIFIAYISIRVLHSDVHLVSTNLCTQNQRGSRFLSVKGSSRRPSHLPIKGGNTFELSSTSVWCTSFPCQETIASSFKISLEDSQAERRVQVLGVESGFLTFLLWSIVWGNHGHSPSRLPRLFKYTHSASKLMPWSWEEPSLLSLTSENLI